MKTIITIITDSVDLSKCLNRYINCHMGEMADTYFMTYAQKAILLSPDLYKSTDLFVLGLMRGYSDGFRAEGIFTAEIIWQNHKKALIISGSAKAKAIANPTYWDLGSEAMLHEQIINVLNLEENYPSNFTSLKEEYRPYYRQPFQHQH